MTMITNIIYLLLICLAAWGCSTPGPSAQAQLETQSPPPTKAIPTSTPVPTATPTPPTPTPTSTARPTKTPTPLPTATETPVPRFSEEKAAEKLNELMKTNGGFPPDEFWGIRPGETKLAEAQIMFAQLREPLYRSSNEKGMDNYSATVTYKNLLTFSPALPVLNDKIQSFYVTFDFLQEIPWSEAWPSYSPNALLTQLGSPSAIQFTLEYPHEPGYPEGTAWYDMTIYFEEVHMAIFYQRAPVRDNGTLVHICPAQDAFSGGRIWFGENPENGPYPGLDLTTVSTLTIENFQKLLTGSPQQACFDLSSKAFYP